MQIPQAKNAKADFLARLASLDDYNAPSELCIEIRGQSSTEGEQVLKIKVKATCFIIIDDVLYK